MAFDISRPKDHTFRHEADILRVPILFLPSLIVARSHTSSKNLKMFHRGLSFGLAVLASVAHGITIEYSRDFPLGSEVENIALRPSGSALVVVNTSPTVWEVKPEPDAEPRLVWEFKNALGASSIAASSKPDEFFIVTGNFSFQELKPAPNSYSIHHLRLDCSGRLREPPTKLADLHQMQQPNGMIHVPKSPFVLIADNRAGFVYRFNTETRSLKKYFDHPLLKPDPDPQPIKFGVNGLKLTNGYLYFSSTNQKLIARIPASGLEPGGLQGTPEIVANNTAVDDFVVNETNGDIYITEQPTAEGGRLSVVRGSDYGSEPTTVAGGPDSDAILGPTAAVWAKGKVGRTLLVTVTGGMLQFATGNYTGGHRVAIVHLE